MDTNKTLESGEKGAWLSIAAYLLLSALKLAVGYFYTSAALFADGLNNTTDIVASFAILLGLKISRRPPDEDHRYGHFRAETIAALTASLIMFAIGLQVAYQAVNGLFADTIRTPDLLTAWVALLCGIFMLGVYRYNAKLAARTNSQALVAASKDNLSDALVSFGAFVGILGSRFGLGWLDPVAAAAVGLIICKTAWDIFRDTTHSLTDGFNESSLLVLQQTVEDTPGVDAVKDIKARTHGNQVLVDVVVEMDAGLSVMESHEITEDIEKRMLEEHRIEHVHVHIEPSDK